MKTSQRYSITMLGAVTALLFASSCSKKATVELETFTVHPMTINESVTATGTVEAVTSVDVGTQVTGIVSELLVDCNDRVTKGQLIAEIDKTVLSSDVEGADANLAAAKATLEYAKANYARDKALHDEKLISDLEYETSLRDFQQAKANYDKAQADRVRAATNLTYAEIYAPIDGVVIAREVEVGQTVVSNMSVANLFVIANLEHMQISAAVDEADIAKVKVGQNVEYTIDAYAGETFSGTVEQVRLNPTTESNVVTYEVIVATANDDMKLIPGMTANLTIFTMEIKDALAVPLKALRFQPQNMDGADNESQNASEHPASGKEGRPESAPADSASARKPQTEKNEEYEPTGNTEEERGTLWVERANGKLERVNVVLGANNNIYRQVVSGLKAGDKVALQYSAPDTSSEQTKQTEESPFMPKRPGQNKK